MQCDTAGGGRVALRGEAGRLAVKTQSVPSSKCAARGVLMCLFQHKKGPSPWRVTVRESLTGKTQKPRYLVTSSAKEHAHADE